MARIRDKRQSGWFWMGGEVIDRFGRELGAYGIAVYAYLAKRASNDDQTCHALVTTIAEAFGASERQVRRELRKLEKLGLIESERKFGRSSKYSLLSTNPDSQSESIRSESPDGPAIQSESCGQTVLPNKTLLQDSLNKTSPRNRGTRLPADFCVTEGHRKFAQENSLPDPDDCIDEFRDYWNAVPGQKGVKLDWDATFRNSLRRARPASKRTAFSQMVDSL